MHTAPISLKPDATAWIQAQLAINHARTTAATQRKIEAVDQWASGLFIALRDVLFHVLIDRPELARHLAADWRGAAAQFEAIEAGDMPASDDVNLDVLEARRLLYRAFTEIGVMPIDSGR